METREVRVPGYARVIWGTDSQSGYRGIVAIHCTTLGPAVGGTRYWRYASDEDALTDALRLARGLTYKNALAGLPCGGGKSIILHDAIADRSDAREKLFRDDGRVVEAPKGSYITGEDVGTSPADMEHIRKETSHVAGLEGGSGDPSPKTARGVFRAMQAAARYRWGSDDLAGRTVAIQGCGHVGYYLAGELNSARVKLVVTDVDQERVKRVRDEFGATIVAPENIFSVDADIFAPCALGGILNDQTIPQLRAQLVVGAANNQLLQPRPGNLL